MSELRNLEDVRALLIAARARDLSKNALNARTPADLHPEDRSRLHWRAALEIAVEELAQVRSVIYA